MSVDIIFALLRLTHKIIAILFDTNIITFFNNFFLYLTFIRREFCLRGHYVIFIKVASGVGGRWKSTKEKKKNTPGTVINHEFRWIVDPSTGRDIGRSQK